MTDTVTGSEGQTTDEPGTQTEEVEITKADDADLEAFLDRARSGEFDEDASPEPQKAKAETEVDQPEEEAKAPPAEEEEKVTLTRRDLEALQQRVAEQERSRQQQERFIKQRNSEVGELRKQLKTARSQLQGSLDDKFHESPGQALEDVEKIKEIDKGLQQLDHEEKLLTHVHTAFEVVSKNVDLEKVAVEDVASVLQDDGFTEAQIKGFFDNPYAAAHGETLIQLFKRAQEKSASKQWKDALEKIVPFTRKLMKEVEAGRAKPEKLLTQVNNALRQGPPISAASGNGGSRRSIADVDVTKLSDSELKELQKQLN